VSSKREAVGQAVRKNVFARGLKTDARPPADLAEEVAKRLREAALGRLGLARKAGAVVAGFAKVEAAIGHEDLAGVLVASDAAEDGRRKMDQALRRRYGDAAKPALIEQFDAAELGLAIGRSNVIHAAVLQSPAGRSFVDAVIRLQRYESVGDRVSHRDVNGAADKRQEA
jgi:ribosomal protein L7Ae-like RNA K-turn-binding protein